jgi:saccharopine dehydrogenase (NAD+, L-lysine-forming)
MGKVLIIGAGGVGSVVAQKCARLPDVFSEITLASRTKEKCDRIAARLDRTIKTSALDADDREQTTALIRSVSPDLVINVALPYQDLSIMDACLEAGVNYLDTANYESPEEACFSYKWQWAYEEKFRRAGLMALLGSGFDPGVTNVFCAYALKHYFDELNYVDIMDCNGGTHGHAFATNFNPEINIREITARGRFWEEGQWKYTEPFCVHEPFDFPQVGVREKYLIYHEELESLVKFLPGLKRIRFWMTFSQDYLTHLRVLHNVGMTGIDPVEFQGQKIVPLQFLKMLLPDPASLAACYKGKTNIGCMISGLKDGKVRKYYIYNVCDHEAAFKEVGAQAISYTAGVPAVVGAKMMLSGQWRGKGVFNLEQLDPDPFMEELTACGLPWVEVFEET